ncbi:sugar ABC transporter substrate-binding protein [Acuticoccus mangrovi]|uniref:Substrate-binding domain-containing protein n=1 Tax=Acuticoccus mangrovi TaxID=2796142 RepID=A0A934ITL1_9HYPH|nr:substrate-binding domain-containing protein [Acuticoccus mangrovi]MBJ3778373.1 substrate-binding domain-containing protein [Acuticoccus mangrovi]
MTTRFFLTSAATTLLAAIACGPAHAAPDLEAAQAIVDEHSQIPTFEPPGEPFDAKACMADKKLFSVPTSSSIPFVDGIETSMEEVAEEIGFEFQQWKNQAQPTQWVQGMEFAINNGFDGIDLMAGIIPSSLGPQAAAAKAAGIQVFATHWADTTTPDDPAATHSFPIPYTRVGEIIGAWITVKTEGKANVLIIGSDDVPATTPYRKSVQATLDKLCDGGCSHTYVNVPVAEWATKIQTNVQGALIADPTINYIVPIYDSMSQFVLPALTITGKKGQVKIATFNGTPFVIDLVRQGEVEMDIGESLGWIARSTIDAEMRSLCGLDVPEDLYVPLLIFDKDNAETAGVPAGFNQGYGDEHVSGYRKLWGLE